MFLLVWIPRQPADDVRAVLSALYEGHGRFQLGEIDDAVECLEVVAGMKPLCLQVKLDTLPQILSTATTRTREQ